LPCPRILRKTYVHGGEVSRRRCGAVGFRRGEEMRDDECRRKEKDGRNYYNKDALAD